MTPSRQHVHRSYLALELPEASGLSLPDGAQLHLRCAGDSQRPLLLLLHQAPSHSAMFEPLMQELAGDYYCVAPDLPGCGQSDALEILGADRQSAISIENLAACLARSLEPMGPPAAVLGHHTGAAVAAEMAARWLPRLQALILSGPPLLNDSMRQQLQNMQQPLPASEDGDHLLALWRYLRAKDPELPLGITEREFAAALLLGAGYRRLYQAVATHDFAGCLESIRCPTLVMAGQQDVLYPALVASLALLADGRLLDLGEGGSYMFDRQPVRLGHQIAEFLHGISGFSAGV